MSALRFKNPDCVFLRIPKTGSTSVINGLLGGKEAAVDIRRDGFPVEWQSCFVFAMVRNPFDRLVSAFKMFRGKNFKRDPLYGCSRLSLALILRLVEDDEKPVTGDDLHARLKRHTIPMTHPYFGLSYAGYVGRFENFEYEWEHLSRLLAVPKRPMPHLRRSKPGDYRRCFSDRDKAVATRIFDRDLRTFEYTF